MAQRDNRPRFPKWRHAAAGRDRTKPIDRRQGQGKTNSAVAMNSPNQAHFFFIKFVTSNSSAQSDGVVRAGLPPLRVRGCGDWNWRFSPPTWQEKASRTP